MAWSRSYSSRNTRLLRSLMKQGRVKVDAENGIVLKRNGKPYYIETNWCGYQRFKVRIWRDGKYRTAWFFVHKAVFFFREPEAQKTP